MQSFSPKEDLILPGRGRARPEILARILRKEAYAASVVRQRAVTKGPGEDRSGGVTWALGGVPSSLVVLKHRVDSSTLTQNRTRTFSGPQGGTWRRLITMADFTDR